MHFLRLKNDVFNYFTVLKRSFFCLLWITIANELYFLLLEEFIDCLSLVTTYNAVYLMKDESRT